MLIVFCFLIQETRAKTLSYLHFSVEEGLPSSEVYDVLEDDQGMMWFATDRGVARFDGYEFEVFTTDDGLPDDVILRLFKDYKGRIWFVSFSGQLSFFQNKNISAYPYNRTIKKVLQSPLIISIYVDETDCLHLGTFSNGYLKINRDETYTLDNQNTAYSNNIKAIEEQYIFFAPTNSYLPKKISFAT